MRKIYIMNPKESFNYRLATPEELEEVKKQYKEIHLRNLTLTGEYYVIDF